MGASVMDILANAPLRQRAALDQSALVRAETQAEAARTPLIQQQTQAAQLQNQLAQQQLKDAQIFRDAYAANPDGDPAKLRDYMLRNGVSGPGFFQWQQHNMDLLQKSANLTKAQRENVEAFHNQAGNIIDAVNSEKDPTVAAAAYSNQLPKLKQFAPDIPWPDQYDSRAGNMLSGLVGHAKAVLEQGKTIAETNEANARAAQATATTAQTQTTTVNAQRQSDALTLAAAARQGPDALRAALDAMPHGRARVFEGMTKPEDIMQLGMTPEQVTQAGETHRHNVQEETGQQAARTETQRHNISEERLKRLEVDPFGMFTGGGAPAAAPGAGAAPPAAATTPGAAVTGPGGPHGEQFLASMPAALAAQVKGLAEGRMAFPAGFALKSPYWQAMISRVAQYDPSFDAVNYNARSKTRNAFTSGREAQQVNALNTAIGHLGEMANAGEALYQGNVPVVNTFVNAASKFFGDPALTNFQAVRDRVVDEVTRLYRGAGGAEQDIKRGLENFSSGASPAQRAGAIRETLDLMKSKMDALEQQYHQGMGTTSQGLTLLNDKAKATMARLGGQAQPASAPTVGTVQEGKGGIRYRFKGGDPTKKDNWEQVE